MGRVRLPLLGMAVFLIFASVGYLGSSYATHSAVGATPDYPDSRLPWVRWDGTEDLSKLPKCTEIGMPDGSSLKNADGSVKCVPWEYVENAKIKVKKGDKPETRRLIKDEKGRDVEVVDMGDQYLDWRDYVDAPSIEP